MSKTTTADATAKECPINLAAWEVRAILDGRKTMTRRVVRPQPGHVPDGYYLDSYNHTRDWCWWTPDRRVANSLPSVRCPYGRPGDRLWVRETWAAQHGMKDHTGSDPDAIYYRADGQVRSCDLLAREMTGDAWEAGPHEAGLQVKSIGPCRWRSPILMPRWTSRITLELTGVRVERLRSIGYADVMAEGCPADREDGPYDDPDDPGSWFGPSRWFEETWDQLNGKHPGCAWADSPWVWVLSFRRADGGTIGRREAMNEWGT